MRLFYGLSLPDDIRAEAAFAARRAEARMPGRYGAPSNYHITLAFLGEVAPERLPDAQAILAGHIAPMPAPTITLGPVDFFGRAENAILILRALCNPPLDALHNALAADAQACGLPSIPARSPRTSPSHGMRRPRLKRWPPFPYPRFPLRRNRRTSF